MFKIISIILIISKIAGLHFWNVSNNLNNTEDHNNDNNDNKGSNNLRASHPPITPFATSLTSAQRHHTSEPIHPPHPDGFGWVKARRSHPAILLSPHLFQSSTPVLPHPSSSHIPFHPIQYS